MATGGDVVEKHVYIREEQYGVFTLHMSGGQSALGKEIPAGVWERPREHAPYGKGYIKEGARTDEGT